MTWKIHLYHLCDLLAGSLCLAIVVASPWWFGTTSEIARTTLQVVAAAAGLLTLAKLLLRTSGYSPPRLPLPGQGPRRSAQAALALLSCLWIAWTVLSIWNHRALFDPDIQAFVEQPFLSWLPASWDARSSRRILHEHGAWLCLFWSLLDWLREQPPAAGPKPGPPGNPFPQRLRLLLAVFVANATLLALEGLVQKASGTNRLLWLVEPWRNKDADSQFGPYAYRSNAAQLLNLAWPVALALWHANRHRPPLHPATFLPPAAATFLLAATFASLSRGGTLVALCLLAAITTFFLHHALRLAATGRFHRPDALRLGLLAAALGASLLLVGSQGWERIERRFLHIDDGLSGRDALHATGREIAADHPWLGTGPGTFQAVSHLYRTSPTELWVFEVHNDWLEFRITHGRIGSLLLLAWFLAALAAGGLPSASDLHSGRLLLLPPLAGLLLHALVDFPFQVTSIAVAFLVVLAAWSVGPLPVAPRLPQPPPS